MVLITNAYPFIQTKRKYFAKYTAQEASKCFNRKLCEAVLDQVKWKNSKNFKSANFEFGAVQKLESEVGRHLEKLPGNTTKRGQNVKRVSRKDEKLSGAKMCKSCRS